MSFALDIVWKYVHPMKSQDYRMSEPEIRSIQLLRSVIEETENMTLLILTNNSVMVEVKGQSKRWYRVESNLTCHFFGDQDGMDWMTTVRGARRKGDLIDNHPYHVELCLHPNNQQLPVGDRLVSLILSLHNDLKTAMKIPLLAQFIVCPREELKDIMILQKDIIVTYSMLEGEEPEPFEEHDHCIEEIQLAFDINEELTRSR